MKNFKADLHIHTLLSPCGSLEMSPENIVKKAMKEKLDMIAITDHNSTKQAPLIREIAKEKGIHVFLGVEVNSREEVHCLCLFDFEEQRKEFQLFLDAYLPDIKNKPDYFGHQIVVDEKEIIIEEVEPLLINALGVNLAGIAEQVRKLGGLLIPAHIDRPYNGLLSQLGFFPNNFFVDAVELSRAADLKQWQKDERVPSGTSIIRNSDAHTPRDIGKAYTIYAMQEANIEELMLALHNEQGRRIVECVKK